jgi:hypothetical protein
MRERVVGERVFRGRSILSFFFAPRVPFEVPPFLTRSCRHDEVGGYPGSRSLPAARRFPRLACSVESPPDAVVEVG